MSSTLGHHFAHPTNKFWVRIMTPSSSMAFSNFDIDVTTVFHHYIESSLSIG